MAATAHDESGKEVVLPPSGAEKNVVVEGKSTQPTNSR
jgi:hypothetical protein